MGVQAENPGGLHGGLLSDGCGASAGCGSVDLVSARHEFLVAVFCGYGPGVVQAVGEEEDGSVIGNLC